MSKIVAKNRIDAQSVNHQDCSCVTIEIQLKSKRESRFHQTVIKKHPSLKNIQCTKSVSGWIDTREIDEMIHNSNPNPEKRENENDELIRSITALDCEKDCDKSQEPEDKLHWPDGIVVSCEHFKELIYCEWHG